MADGLAIRESLIFCKSYGLQSCRLESDSSQLIKAIDRKKPISEFHSVLSDIANLSISFSWISRNQKVVVGMLLMF